MRFSLFRKIADMREDNSFITKLRRRRMQLFFDLLKSLPPPIRILDIGGTQFFWDMVGFAASEQYQITLLNPISHPTYKPYFSEIIGDGRDLHSLADQSFDVVFSNSVIEHVGTFSEQQQMAREIQRVGKCYFVQTPNYFFPLEPHFFVVGFQYLPIAIRTWLLQHFNLGWFRKIPDYAQAYAEVSSIRLLRRHEVVALFPHAQLRAERFGPLAVSWIAIQAGDQSPGANHST